MIRITVTGHLGKDATVKLLEGGRYVTNFNVAHTKKWTDHQGTKMEKTTWVSCSYWTDRNPGIAPYLLRGTQVLVEGEPEADFYNSGVNGLVGQLKCRISHIELMGGGNRSNHAPAAGGGQAAAPAQAQGDDQGPPDDLPF